MSCCRDKAKPWSLPAVNQILFGMLLVSLPCTESSDFETWEVVMVILKRRSNR